MLRAEEWELSSRTAALAFVAPVVGGVAVAAAARDRAVYRFVVREDGLLEWAQVAAWVAAIVAAAVVARRTRGRERALWVLFVLAGAAAIGEELSWGQRLLDFGTPDVLRDADKQEEATLHNHHALESPVRAAVLAVSAAGAVAPFVTRRVPVIVAPAFALTALYELARLFAGDSPDYRFAKYAEWPELCFAGALAAVAVCTARRLE